MNNSLVIPGQPYADIVSHLLQNHFEQVAFVFAKTTHTGNGVEFTAIKHHLVQPEELAFQSPYHVELGEDTQAKLIKEAWDLDASLVELHSHPNSRWATEFSASDLHGFEEFVPHIWWRLRGKPYAALVVGHTGFDALVWCTSPNTPEDLTYLRCEDRELQPTSLTLKKLRR